MKLWQKGEPIDKLFERFTIGKDRELDLELAYYDVVASKAHVNMLEKIGLLSIDEKEALISELEHIRRSAEEGTFTIDEGVEDCHSQIELILTQKLGDVGKKVHTGRSRNDQVLVALKLFTRAQLELIAQQVKQFFELLQRKSEANKGVLMPGYTHMQVAMPASFGLWFGAYAESLSDDLVTLKASHQIVNKNPLGSGAGFGSSFPLDRTYTAAELGFESLNYNVVYAQMTRGKMERVVAQAIGNIAQTLARYAMDVCLYAGQNYDFLRLDTAYTTGSSIMPHKHNPDGFELVRAKCNQLQSLPYELNLMTNNLPSGYHRDFQTLKEHFIPSFRSLVDCLEVATAMTEKLEVNPEVIQDSKYDLLFTVEEVNQLVIAGVPFRDAYRKVGEKLKAETYEASREVNHTHVGSIGNLGNDEIDAVFNETWKYFSGFESND
ncbi:MAG: argininosuccinate lyase [Bacteroidota bacterium]